MFWVSLVNKNKQFTLNFTRVFPNSGFSRSLAKGPSRFSNGCPLWSITYLQNNPLPNNNPNQKQSITVADISWRFVVGMAPVSMTTEMSTRGSHSFEGMDHHHDNYTTLQNDSHFPAKTSCELFQIFFLCEFLWLDNNKR